jgi:integrase
MPPLRLVVAVEKQEIVVSAKARTFKQVREEWQQTRKIGKRTAEARDSNLKLYAACFENKKIRDLKEPQLLVWLNLLRSASTGKALSEGSKEQILAAVSDVFRHAVKMRDIPRNPVSGLEKEDRPRQGEGPKRILTPDEEDRLLLYSANFDWLRGIVTVARAQALRLGEVAGLDWPDVDFTNNKLRVHQQLQRDGTLGPTKGANARKGRRDRRDLNPIDLMPEAREVLLRLRMDSDGTGSVFRNRDGNRRHPRLITRAFEKAVRYASLPETADGKVTFHSLRHTACSRLANHPEIPLVYVRDFAGHANLATTEKYVHRIEQPTVTAAAAAAMAGREVRQLTTMMKRETF